MTTSIVRGETAPVEAHLLPETLIIEIDVPAGALSEADVDAATAFATSRARFLISKRFKAQAAAATAERHERAAVKLAATRDAAAVRRAQRRETC